MDLGGYHRGDVPFLLAHMIPCSTCDSVDSDPLMKMVFVRFLHCQITSYSLIVGPTPPWGMGIKLYPTQEEYQLVGVG